MWKTIIKQSPGNVSDLLIHDHHLIKTARILRLEKLSSKELYWILIRKFTLDWRNIYILPRITTFNTYLHTFQYKILKNILFLNKKLSVFQKKNTPLWSFCNKEEIQLHIFSDCTNLIYLWQHLATFFENNLILPALTPDCLVWALEWQCKSRWIHYKNHVLLIYKLYMYNSREKHCLNIMDLLTNIKEIKKTGYRLSSNNGNKIKIYENKWRLTHSWLNLFWREFFL